MTCVGLLALAVGRSWQPESTTVEQKGEKPTDPGITLGLSGLSSRNAVIIKERGWPNGRVDLYYLWSVERVAVLCGLKTIGGTDWYRGGLGHILPSQLPNGSWNGTFTTGHSAVITTSMALLFLRRSDLLPDLRETLQKRVSITDPGLDKAISPGEKSKTKSGTKSPGEKSDTSEKKSDLKQGIPKKKPEEKSRPQSRSTTPVIPAAATHEAKLA
jgi:hypothetical protein